MNDPDPEHTRIENPASGDRLAPQEYGRTGSDSGVGKHYSMKLIFFE